jgi:uncharacterized protein DUF3833
MIDPPTFEPERYFAGRTRAWGMVQDRFGRLRRRFTVEMEGHWDGEVLRLDEAFRYDDGTASHRTWHVRRTAAGTYSGEASDVVGKAVGVSDGATLTWRYRLRLPIGRRVWTIRFHDVMYLQDGEVMINRAEMRKLGLRLGELTIMFRRLDAARPDASTLVTGAAAGGG